MQGVIGVLGTEQDTVAECTAMPEPDGDLSFRTPAEKTLGGIPAEGRKKGCHVVGGGSSMRQTRGKKASQSYAKLKWVQKRKGGREGSCE